MDTHAQKMLSNVWAVRGLRFQGQDSYVTVEFVHARHKLGVQSLVKHNNRLFRVYYVCPTQPPQSYASLCVLLPT